MSMLALALAGSRAGAQNGAPVGDTRLASASRAELDSLATRAETAANSPVTPETKRESLRRFAADARTRLRDGDFQPNDKIVVVTRGDSIRVDTLTVQSDRSITLSELPPIALGGVLRSELQGRLSEQLRQYVRREVVRATPLVSVGILGEVVHPGYYRVPLQITLSDLLMVAGGPSPQADLSHVRIQRGQTTVVNERTVRDAMVRGLPLGQLGVDAGDEVVLKPVHQHNWLLMTQLAGVATGIFLTLRTFKAF
ncbi:MAG TPA: SLBB domain-containing protein [Gemmatimonadaceae bacterium]|nr:SLBB domain-containing protein [Gemmatimonadaceae bacterium]